jgi:GAF domain-containing protein
MGFAAGLQDSLQFRQGQVLSELTKGDSLRHVLSRHLLAVEAMADCDMITSVLLLSGDGKRLSHGAAPRLPQSYCEAIDGTEIGPCAGSCGTAAYLGRAVYVSDISTDPLWDDYRHVARPHGLRSCWSTPIRDKAGTVIATFAIYHRTTGHPTGDEIEAIGMIADHVAQAIMWARGTQDLERPSSKQIAERPRLKLVCNNEIEAEVPLDLSALQGLVARLQSKAADLDDYADRATSSDAAATLRSAAELSRTICTTIGKQIDFQAASGDGE